VTNGMRWRIMTLQAILVLVLAGAAGFLYSEATFVSGYIHDELVAQRITFPAASEIKTGGALDPAEFPASIRQYAGQPLDNGDKAFQYANNFIGKHLEGVAKDPVSGQVVKDPDGNTMTYATMGDYINQQKAAGASASTLTTLNGERDTMFKGEMLRGTLLSAWGWSQVAYYTYWAAIGLAVAALITLFAFLYEIYAWRRESSQVALKTPKSAAQPA
jgi:hypothetical protein